MSDKCHDGEVSDLKELLISEVFQAEALVNLLEKKGIISKKELQDEVVKVSKKLFGTESQEQI